MMSHELAFKKLPALPAPLSEPKNKEKLVLTMKNRRDLSLFFQGVPPLLVVNPH